jgi:hypothetical protein
MAKPKGEMRCDRSIGFPKVCLATTATWILTVPHNLSGISINNSAQLGKSTLLDNPDNAQWDEITGITDNIHGISTHTPFCTSTQHCDPATTATSTHTFNENITRFATATACSSSATTAATTNVRQSGNETGATATQRPCLLGDDACGCRQRF